MAEKFRSYGADDPYIAPRRPAADPVRQSGGHPSEPGDPLAELARLIGQDDPFSANRQHPQRNDRSMLNDGDPAPQWLTGGSRDPHREDNVYDGHDRGSYDNRYNPSRPNDSVYSRGVPSQGYEEQGWGERHAQGTPAYGRSRYDEFDAEHRSRSDARYGHATEPAADHGDHGAYRDPRVYDDVRAYGGQRAYGDSPAYIEPQGYGAVGGRETSGYGSDPYAATEYGAQDASRLSAHDQTSSGYDSDRNYPDTTYDGAERDVPAPRRRTGAVVLVSVTVLAIVGVAGAFGYRAYTRGAGPAKTPVIMADTTPNKVVPAAPKSEGSGKLIHDRVADRGQGERVVSREEQPVEVKPPRIVLPGGPAVQVPQPPPWTVTPAAPSSATASATPQSTPAPGASGNGGANNEPRRVRTMTIRPDSSPGATPERPSPPVRSAAIGPTPVPGPAPSAASAPSAPPRAARAPATTQGPLAISPQADPAPAPAPARTASLPAARAAADGGIMVQLTSQRTESEAQASYRALQTRYPAVLGSRDPVIRRADLGSKGIYYRAQVGPFSTTEQANEFCGSLRAAGGQCIVQRN